MSRAEELKAIARALRNDSRTSYFKSWTSVIIQAFIRDGGRCVYCGADVLGGCGNADHLLPRRYTELAGKIENRVTACGYCNRVKGNYDPSEGKGAELDLTDEVRKGLIDKTEKKFALEKKARDLETDFPTARLCFEEAVAKYRDSNSLTTI